MYLVTGGTGTIGRQIVKKLLNVDFDVTIFSRDEHKQYEMKHELARKDRVKFIIGDVRDYSSLHSALRGIRYCFHAAALKHVPSCEEYPFEAVKTNIIGTQNLIEAAIDRGLYRVLAISTDKAVEPSSALGASKLLMEKLIKAAPQFPTKFASIRFANVLNSRGSVLPLWQEQARKGGPLTVTDKKAMRYFISIEDAVDRAIEVFVAFEGGETFILNNSGPKNIYTMAEEIANGLPIKITGLRPGEKLVEKLISEEEKNRLVPFEDGYIV